MVFKSTRKSMLHRLGEHLEPGLQRLVERERVTIFLLCAVLAMLIAMEGVSALLGGPRLLAAWLFGLLVVVGYGWYHLRQVRSGLQDAKHALDEERSVHAQLAGVAALGARVFLRVPVGGKHIDVVILSQHGVYAGALWLAGERRHAPAKVAVEEQKFRFAGTVVTPNPLRSAAEHVPSLQQILRIGRTDDVVVRPIVIVAGALLEVERHSGAPDVAVVSIDSLDNYIKSQPEELAVTEVMMHTVRLVAHIREQAV